MKDIKDQVNVCKKCGAEYGNSATGFGKERNPDVFFIAINPHVLNHEFHMGEGIKKFLKELESIKFNDFYFDNVIKCEMPGDFKPGDKHAKNCLPYLLDQIKIVKPKRIIVLGMDTAKWLNVPYKAFNSTGVMNEIPVITVPHFSYVLYNPFYYDEYYKKLKEVITCREAKNIG